MVSLRHPSTLPVVGVVADGQTYRQLFYLLLAVPLGFAYSAVFTVGLTVGFLLSAVLVGLVVLLALVLGARLVAGFERWLANRLLGTDLVAYDDVPDDVGGRLAGVRKYTDATSTWRGVGFLSLKFFIMFLAFVPIFGLASALPLVAGPFRYPYTASFGEVNGEPVTWAITTLPEALVGLSLGVVGVVVFLHVSNLIAYVARRMAVALLGDSAVSDSGAVTGDSGASVAAEDDSGGMASENESAGDRSAEDRFEYVAFDDEDGAETVERDGAETVERDGAETVERDGGNSADRDTDR